MSFCSLTSKYRIPYQGGKLWGKKWRKGSSRKVPNQQGDLDCSRRHKNEGLRARYIAREEKQEENKIDPKRGKSRYICDSGVMAFELYKSINGSPDDDIPVTLCSHLNRYKGGEADSILCFPLPVLSFLSIFDLSWNG